MSTVNLNVGVNTGGFKSGMAEISNGLKNVNSQFNLAATKAKLYGSEQDQLGVKSQHLSSKMDLQSKKINLIKDAMSDGQKQLDTFTKKQTELASEIDDTSAAYEESVKATGKNSQESKALADKLDKLKKSYDQTEKSIDNKKKSLMKLDTELNNSKTDLVKMESELKDTQEALDKAGKEADETGKDFEELGDSAKSSAKDIEKVGKSSKDVGTDLDDSGEKGTGWGSKLSTAGGVAAKGIAIGAAAATAAVAAMGKLALSTGEVAGEITKFSAACGLSTDTYQEWDYVMKANGYSMEQASGDFAALAEKAVDAVNGGESNIEMFKKLGVSLVDASGEMRDMDDIIGDTISGLQGMENDTERAAAATEALSTTGEEMAAILGMSCEELEEFKKSANIMTPEQIEQANQFNLQWGSIKNTFAGLGNTLGTMVIPVFSQFLDVAMVGMQKVQEVLNIAIGDSETKFADMAAAIGLPSEQFTNLSTNLSNTYNENIAPLFERFRELWSDTVTNFTSNMGLMTSSFGSLGSLFGGVGASIGEICLLIGDNLAFMWDFWNNNIGNIMILWNLFCSVLDTSYNAVIAPLITLAVSAIELVRGKIEEHMPMIQGIINDCFNFLSGLWYNVLQPVFTAIQGVIENVLVPVFQWAFENVIGPIIDSVFGAINFAWNGVLKPVFDGIMMIINDHVMPVINENLPKIQEIFDRVFGAIKSVWDETLKPAFDQVVSFVMDTLVPNFQEYIPMIQEIVGDVFKKIGEFWDTYLAPVFNDIIDYVLEVLVPAFEEWMPKIQKVIGDVFDKISAFWTGTLQPVFASIADFVMNTLFPTISSVFGSIANIIGQAFTFIVGVWQSYLMPAFAAIGSFISTYVWPIVSTVFGEIANVVGGVFNFIVGAWETFLKPAFEAICDFVSSVFAGEWAGAWDAIGGLFGAAWDGIVALFDGIIGWFSEKFTWLTDAIGGMFGWLVDESEEANSEMEANEAKHHEKTQTATEMFNEQQKAAAEKANQDKIDANKETNDTLTFDINDYLNNTSSLIGNGMDNMNSLYTTGYNGVAGVTGTTLDEIKANHKKAEADINAQTATDLETLKSEYDKRYAEIEAETAKKMENVSAGNAGELHDIQADSAKQLEELTASYERQYGNIETNSAESMLALYNDTNAKAEAIEKGVSSDMELMANNATDSVDGMVFDMDSAFGDMQTNSITTSGIVFDDMTKNAYNTSIDIPNYMDSMSGDIANSWNYAADEANSASDSMDTSSDVFGDMSDDADASKRSMDKSATVFSRMASLAETHFRNMRSSINFNMVEARKIVEREINSMHSYASRSWRIAAPKVPKFSMRGSFNAETGSVPRITTWYSSGAIFKGKTILDSLGIGVGDKYNGVGNNAEAIVPLDSLYRNIESIVDRSNRNHGSDQPVQIVLQIENFNNESKADIKQIAEELSFYANQKLKTKGVK